ncbi:MAG TPA: hypothetical protein VNZ54_11310 [bacterium]|jgi:hypothetical protein|nr:hypothetical protein [bacterium]HXB98632.1 hypothetical protein [bacterium]HXC65438.1 hypothetical protein [bacterium]
MKTLCLALWLAAAPLAADPAPAPLPAAEVPARPPSKLSDLYKVFTLAARDALRADVQAWPVRILGRSWELVKGGVFPEVEFTLKPFETQGLKFEKADLLFRHLVVDTDALQRWQVKLKDVREVQTRLVFTLRSLAMKLSAAQGQDLKLQADLDAQQLLLSGPGRFLFIPCQVEARCEPRWDDQAKTLVLAPLEQRFGGHRVPRWLWWLGRSPAPQAPVLDLGFSWIPFNIQEVHVGWDRVNLSTNW